MSPVTRRRTPASDSMPCMNVEGLRKKLLAAARAQAPDDRVPYAFEKRVMASLTGRPASDDLAIWARAMWRSAASCVGVMLLFGAFSFLSTDNGNNRTSDEFSQDFEQTMLAAVDQSGEVW